MSVKYDSTIIKLKSSHIVTCRLEQEAIDEEANHLRQLEKTKQQVVRDKQGRLQTEIDAVAVSEEERKEVCSYCIYM